MGDNYMLGRNANASQRLNVSHRMWFTNVGYILHPSITSSLGPAPRIADVATGTTIWLSHLSRDLPASTLVGFDISPAQYPAKVPDNVSLVVHDAKTPFPSEYLGTFDVVHIRLLVVAMDRTDYPNVINNVLGLLKPGGALQWDEASYNELSVLRGDPGSTKDWLERIEFGFVEAYRARLSAGWCTLPADFAEAGLTHIVRDKVGSDRVVETREGMTRVLSVGVFEWAQALEDAGQPIWTRGELRELHELVERDIRSGAYTRFEIHICVGRKRKH